VRLLCNTAAISEYLPPLLGPFLAAHADIDIELRELDSRDVLFAMRQERADLGIVADHVIPEGLTTLPLREDHLVAVLPAAWARRLGARKAGIAFAALLEQPFVGLPGEAGLSRFLQGRALQHGRGLHHRVQVQGFDALLRLVADGVGVAIVPALTAQRLARPGVVSAPLAESWARRQLLLCFGKAEELTPGAAALLAALRP
jgi:DNA-binding transcriptional LysR family regulator